MSFIPPPPILLPTAQWKGKTSYQESLGFGDRNGCKLTCKYYMSTAFFTLKDNTHIYKWCLSDIFKKSFITGKRAKPAAGDFLMGS